MRYKLAFPTEAQADEIAGIWASGWHEAHADLVPGRLLELRTRKSFLERTRKGLSRTRVASDGTDVLGFCMVKENELFQLYVSPQARGTGVAQTLIEDAENRIRNEGHDMAWLACAIGNKRAVRFYEKSGWICAGRTVVNLNTSGGAFPLEVWRYENSW